MQKIERLSVERKLASKTKIFLWLAITSTGALASLCLLHQLAGCVYMLQDAGDF
jgi:hypothetical protein